jgi:hypothetical protein
MRMFLERPLQEPKSYHLAVQFSSILCTFMYIAARGSSLLDTHAYDNHAQLEDTQVRGRRATGKTEGTPLVDSDPRPTVGFDVRLTIKRVKRYLHEQNKIVTFSIRTVKLKRNVVFDLGNYLVAYLHRCRYLDGDPAPEALWPSAGDVLPIKPEKLELPIWRRLPTSRCGLLA